MAKKSAVKKTSSKKIQAKEPAKKQRSKQKATKKTGNRSVAKKSSATQKIQDTATPKAIKTLLSKGKKQGYLTYDEINELLPEDMLYPEQIDETLMLFYANNTIFFKSFS